MSFTRESITKELQRIQASAPDMLKKMVVRQEKLTPVMEMIVDKALESEDFSEEKKQELRALKERGYFEKKVFIEDPQIAKQLDQYVSREINKSIKAGRLPTKKKLKELKTLWKEQDKTTSKS